MACTGACDKACTCDCRGQRGTRAARSELDDVRAQVTRLEAELADRKPAGSYPGRPRQPEFPLAPGRPWWLAIAELLASPPPGFLGAEVP